MRTANSELSERDESVLSAIVKDYIAAREPVSSRTVSGKCGMKVSPATIRNIAADLEERGYLTQPHTSSGRVPTDKGYRFYVDALLHPHHLTTTQKKRIEDKYAVKEFGLQEVMEETSKLLSRISHHVGIVLAPKVTTSQFEHIEFIKLSSSSIMVVMVAKSGAVYNKRIHLAEPFTQRDLHRVSNYLSSIMLGLTLIDIRRKIVTEMQNEQIRCNKLFSKALNIFNGVVKDDDYHEELYIDGAVNIIDVPIYNDITEMKKLLRAFEDKKLLVRLLDKSIETDGITTFIGKENASDELQNCSVVSSKYGRDGNTLGTLGVIGPRSMDYASVIPLVDYMSKLVSRMVEITS